MRLYRLLLLAVAGLPIAAQVQPFSGVNGLGHSTYYCLDADGDGYGIGPTVIISTTSSSAISAGTQTITPVSMSGGTITGTLTSGSTTVAIPNLANGVTPSTDLLQIGETVTGSGIPAGTTITGVAISNATATYAPPSFVLSQAATTSATEALTIGIGVGTVLRVGTVSNMERVVVTSTTGATFTAAFAISHPSGVLISDQGCLGWDSDDNDSLVWNQTQIQNKYEGGISGTSFPHFRQKIANDLLLEQPGQSATIAAFVSALKSPTTIYYLAPSTATPAGNDANSASSCSITAPCLTFTGLHNAGYTASSTNVLIFMRNGWSGRIQPFTGTTSPVIVMSYPGELASLVANGDAYDNMVEASDVSWFYLRDIQFQGSRVASIPWGPYIDGGTTIGYPNPPSITFHDDLFQDIDGRGPFYNEGGVFGFDMSNISVDHSAFYDDDHDHGIYMGSRTFQSTNVLYQRLLLHHNEWNGLHFNGRCSGCTFQQIVSFANGISGLDFEMGVNHSTIQGNLLFSNAKGMTFYDYESGQCPARVSKHDFTGTTTSGSNIIAVTAGDPILSSMQVGDWVVGTGIPSGDTVTAIGTTTITLTSNATASGTVTLDDEQQYAAGTVQICPYDQSYNVIANNTVVQTGNDASYPINQGDQCGGNGYEDCGGNAIVFTNSTQIASTNNQQQVGDLGHNTITNNILVSFGSNNIYPSLLFGENTDANDPFSGTPLSCDSKCQNWMATDSVVDNVFYQSDGNGGANIIENYLGTYYTCSTATSVVGTSGGAFSGCIDSDPKFADYANSYYTNDSRFDFRLLSSSPAYQAGSTAHVPGYDLVGRSFLDDKPSIGAIERNPWQYGWNDLGASTAMGPSVCPADGAPNGTNTIDGFGNPDTAYPFQAYCHTEVEDWTDGFMRDSPGHTKQLCWFDGGHGDYIGNEVYCVSVNTATPSITRVSGPSTLAGDPGSGATFTATVDGSGHVSSVTVTNGGINYLGSTRLVFTPTGGDTVPSNSAAEFSAKVVNGSVVSVAQIYPGSGYIHVPTVTTPTQSENGSSVWLAGDPGVPELSDGTPNARHTTGSFAYNPSSDSMLMFAGALVNGPHFNDTWSYSLGSYSWTRVDPTNCTTDCASRNAVGGAIDPTQIYSGFDSMGIYNPIQKNYFYLWDNTGGTTALTYNPSSNEWISNGDSPSSAFLINSASTTWGAMRALIPDRQLYYMLWSSSTPVQQDAGKFDLSQISTTAWTSAFTDISTAIDASCNALYKSSQSSPAYPSPGLTYNQATNKLMGYIANGGGTYYTMDPDSLTCSTVSLTGGPSTANNPYIFGRFAYSPSLDATVLYQDYGQDAYVLSLNAPDPGPAGAPSQPWHHGHFGNFTISGSGSRQ